MGMVWEMCSFGCMRLRKGSMDRHRSRWPRPCMYVTVTSAALLTPDNRHSICPEDKVWEKQPHDSPKGLGEKCQVPGSFYCSTMTFHVMIMMSRYGKR